MTQFDLAQKAQVVIARPTLSGGISQQPAALRHPNTVEDAENFDFSVFHGASKRAGTELTRIVDIAGLVSGGDYRCEGLRRDEAEQYALLWGVNSGGDMEFFPLEEGGPPATVTLGTGVQTYLNYGAATANDIRVFPIADGAYIWNTKVPTGLLTSPSYTLTTTFKNADVMISNSPDEGTYHRALADGDDFDAGYYQYSQGADGRTFARWQCEKEHINWTGWDEFTTRDWGDTGKSGMGFRIGFRRVAVSDTGLTTAATATANVFTLNKVGVFTNYTYEAGDMVRVTGGAGAAFPGTETFGWATVLSKDSNDQITVQEYDGSNYRAGTSVALTAGAANVDINGIGREYEVAVDIPALMASGDVTDLYDIAAAWQQAFQDAGEDDVTVSWIKIGGTGEWRITGPWKGGDALVYETQSPLIATYDMTADDRPFTNSSGEYNTYAGVAGTHPTNATARVPLEDRWTRVPAPSQPEWKPDPAKMPVLMTRTGYTGDGTTPATFTINQIAWVGRDTGDEDTNPAPEAFQLGRKITALTLHQGRLMFGAGEYLVASETNNYYNFYLVDDTALADSDFFELSVPGRSVASIWDITPIGENLFITTNAAAGFEAFSDAAWTPSSVRIKPTVNLELLNVRPTQMDGGLYFASRQHSRQAARIAAEIREYSYREARGGNAPENVAEHVPLFFEDDIRRIVAFPAQGVLCVLSEGSLNTLYVWRTYKDQDGRRQQSAWTKYTFADDIVDMCVLTSGLQLFFETGGGDYTQEYLRFEPDITSLGKAAIYGPEDYPRRQDRSIAKSGTYDAGNGWTTWTLTDPYGVTMSDNAYNSIVSPDGIELTVSRPTASTIRATGNFSGPTYRIGITYDAFIVPSRDYAKTEGFNVPAPGHGFIITQALVHFRRSGPFDVIVERESGMGDVTRTFTPRSTPLEEEGVYRIFGVGPNDQVSLRFESNNARPVVIPTYQLIGSPTPVTLY